MALSKSLLESQERNIPFPGFGTPINNCHFASLMAPGPGDSETAAPIFLPNKSWTSQLSIRRGKDEGLPLDTHGKDTPSGQRER